MAIPSVTLTTVDPGLPKSAPGTVTALCVGVATSGTIGTVLSFGSEKAVLDEYTSGPLAESLIDCLRKGGAPVLGCRLTGAVVGSNSAVVSAGTTPPTLTLTGTATDYIDLRVEITTAGALGTSRFRYSLDGGITFSQTRATVASHVMAGTGITLGFAAGTYAADNVYTATCEAKALDSTDITALQTAILASPRKYDVIVLAGRGRTASAMATLWAAVASMMSALEAAKRYQGLLWIQSAGTESAASTQTAFASTTSSMGIAAFGFRYAPAFVPLEGRGYAYKPLAHDLGALASGNLISTDLARLSLGFGDTLSDAAGAPRISHDEAALQSMNDLGFATYRTWDRPGVFVTNAVIKSPFGSDFTFSQRRLVFNRARAIAYNALLDWIGKNVRTNPDNIPNPGDQGTIQAIDAVKIERYVLDRLKAGIMREQNADGFPGHATAVGFGLDRSYNTLASDGLQGAVQIVPLTAVKTITATIGFVRQLGA
jgi:hypothetical protein